MLGEIRRQMRVHPDEELLNDKQLDMLDTITKIYRQQKNHFNSGDSRESIPNRIVSVSKPYIRPIGRGKETKTVEFGAKCNNILNDGNWEEYTTKRELARVRATAMEGSFGTQKEHYGLRKIAARIKSTEIMLIFFGIHTANVVNLARRESVQVA
ncbi:MAG: DDE transposase, partial [Bacteroidales bacterium]|nr:DDE transposase [Bacteroidales bacterium]